MDELIMSDNDIDVLAYFIEKAVKNIMTEKSKERSQNG